MSIKSLVAVGVLAVLLSNYLVRDFLREMVQRVRHRVLRQPDGLHRLEGAGRGPPSARQRVCIVTGANGDIGFRIAVALARRGFHVVATCRSQEKVDATVKRITAACGEGAGPVTGMVVDISSLKDVQRFAREVAKSVSRVDILINNAGIMGIPLQNSVDGFEMQLATNYLGPFLLSLLLLPLLKESRAGRVVNVSSVAHCSGTIRLNSFLSTDGYRPMLAYGTSKLAMLMGSFEFHQRYSIDGVSAVAVHPGCVDTGLWGNLPKAAQIVCGAFAKLFFKNPEHAARSVVWAATTPLASKNKEPIYTADCEIISPHSNANDHLVRAQLWDKTLQILRAEKMDV